MLEAKGTVIRRVVTAAVLLSLLFLLVLLASNKVFGVVTALLVLWGGVEWVNLMGMDRRHFLPIVLYLSCLLMLIGVALTLVPVPWVMMLAALWWIVAAVLVCRYPRSARYWTKSLMAKGAMGFICLIPCWMAVNYIRISFINGRITLLFVFLLIAAADSGAWFFGRQWGRHKLLPAVSPGKSREGLLGGFVASLCLVLYALWWSSTPWIIWPGAIVLSMVTVAFSVIGDLFESMLKREAGIKDSGKLLPGHGGLLDRIDSLMAAAPVFVAGAMLFDKILR